MKIETIKDILASRKDYLKDELEPTLEVITKYGTYVIDHKGHVHTYDDESVQFTFDSRKEGVDDYVHGRNVFIPAEEIKIMEIYF